MDEDNIVHMHNRLLLSHDELLPCGVTGKELEIIILSKVSSEIKQVLGKSKIKTSITWAFSHVESKIVCVTEIETRLMVFTWGGGIEGGMWRG